MSHLGLSGSGLPTRITTTAGTGPITNARRQPTSGAKALRKTSETNEPRMAPAQYVPLIQMSTRPRYLDGIISSIAELIAAYWPPIPIPAMNRVA